MLDVLYSNILSLDVTDTTCEGNKQQPKLGCPPLRMTMYYKHTKLWLFSHLALTVTAERMIPSEV